MANTSILAAFERFWQHVVAKVGEKADLDHTHDDRYYTETEVDTKLSAKANTSHTHTKSEVGLGNVDNTADSAKSVKYATSAGSATSATSATKATQDASGNVITTTYELKSDASAKLAEAKTYADSKVSGLASTSTVDTKISTHNTSTSAHSDIRTLITDLTTKLNNFLDVDDTTTDQLSEVITLINNNKGTLESLTTSKVNVSDIVNNLTTASTSKVLSANQGVAIKSLIDALQSEQSELDNRANAIESEISAVSNAASNANAKAGTAQDTADEAYTLAESKADANHTHSEATQADAGLLSASDKIKLDYGGPAIVTTSGTGAAYTATVTGMNELKAGMSFIMIPHTVSTAAAPTLNVNSLGAKAIRRRVTNATTTTATGYNASWLSANKPIRVEFDGTFWIADLPKPAAADMSGTLPVKGGGTGKNTVTAGNFLVGDGTNTMVEKTPAEVLTHIGITATAAELNYMDGVTSNVQTQIDSLKSSLNTEQWTFTLEDGSTVTKAVYIGATSNTTASNWYMYVDGIKYTMDADANDEITWAAIVGAYPNIFEVDSDTGEIYMIDVGMVYDNSGEYVHDSDYVSHGTKYWAADGE